MDRKEISLVSCEACGLEQDPEMLHVLSKAYRSGRVCKNAVECQGRTLEKNR